jgi:hypothetical protein
MLHRSAGGQVIAHARLPLIFFAGAWRSGDKSFGF